MTAAVGLPEARRLEYMQRLKELRLMDDDFLNKCFEGDTACAELVLQIILAKPDLRVTDVRTQVFLENLPNRSVRLDILATDSAGTRYNIEIQRSDKGAGRRRARYNASMMDAIHLEKSEDFKTLPEVYVVFITEHDVMRRGLPVYRIERQVLETGESFGDGSHILYVNGAYRDETPIGKLMHDFSCTDPAEMHYKVLADRVDFFKNSKEGNLIMCKAMEDIREAGVKEGMKEGIKEGIKATALRMLETGKYALEEIAAISGLAPEEVEQLRASRGV